MYLNTFWDLWKAERSKAQMKDKDNMHIQFRRLWH